MLIAKKQLRDEEILQIPDMRMTMTNRQIAEKLGCSLVTVFRWVRKLKELGVDVPERKNGRPRKI